MKFRGLTESGEWVEGYYIKDKGIPYIFPFNRCKNYGLTFLGNFRKIIRISLAMSTGLKDKNGKEIFGSIELEDGTMSKGGDRVKLRNDYGALEVEVRWQKKYARWILYWDDLEDGKSYVLINSESDVEVIGTQYEKEK